MDNDRDALEWWKGATVSNQSFLLPDPAAGLRTFGDYPATTYANLLDEFLQNVAAVENVGSEVLILNQTRPDVGLSVAKVLAPGMRHFWQRFAPGRLFDVPVKLRWQETATSEGDLNPIPMFL